jgi:hypothetical protein
MIDWLMKKKMEQFAREAEGFRESLSATWSTANHL